MSKGHSVHYSTFISITTWYRTGHRSILQYSAKSVITERNYSPISNIPRNQDPDSRPLLQDTGQNAYFNSISSLSTSSLSSMVYRTVSYLTYCAGDLVGFPFSPRSSSYIFSSLIFSPIHSLSHSLSLSLSISLSLSLIRSLSLSLSLSLYLPLSLSLSLSLSFSHLRTVPFLYVSLRNVQSEHDFVRALSVILHSDALQLQTFTRRVEME
jgi:hypothetical protein